MCIECLFIKRKKKKNINDEFRLQKVQLVVVLKFRQVPSVMDNDQPK
jgi:hypothetical protein